MIQKPRGTQDLFLQQAKDWNSLLEKIRQIMKLYNYGEIITPIFETKELFARGVGDSSDIVSKEMYEFFDRKNRTFVLRPEFTAPTVRALIENKLYLPENLPLKFFYMGPLFRYERPQAGRYRQFNQFGVEVFGNDSVEQDVELISLANMVLQACKLQEEVRLEINYLINGAERIAYENALKKSLLQIGTLCDDCQVRISKNILRVLDCKVDQAKFIDLPLMTEFISQVNQTRLETTVAQLKQLNIDAIVNPKLVRGLDYYTGLVFELINSVNNQAIIAGGSYNNLVESLGGPSLPAAGFAMGLERVMLMMKTKQTTSFVEPGLDAFIIPLTQQAKDMTNKLLYEARQAQLRFDTNWNITNIKNGFKAAERANCENIIVIGDHSIKDNWYQIKSQNKNDIVECKYDEIINNIIKQKEMK